MFELGALSLTTVFFCNPYQKLVVVIVLGVFGAIAYPNVTKWITEREVKSEVYKAISFIDEMKSLASLSIEQRKTKGPLKTIKPL